MRRLLLVLVVVLLLLPATQLSAQEMVIHDQWYIGHIDDSPAISAHGQTVRTDSGYRTRFQMIIALTRTLGPFSSTIRMTNQRAFHENEDGHLTAFQFEDDQDGNRTLVEGRVSEGLVNATIARNGRLQEQALIVPEGVTLLGQQGAQRALAAADLEVGASFVFHSLELMGSRLKLTTTTAVLRERSADGRMELTLTMDLLPLPVTTIIDAAGNLVAMRMALGPLRFVITPHDGPPAIAAATLDAIGLFQAAGATPRPVANNRYRLPAKAVEHLPDGTGFQTRDGDIVTVTSTAERQALAEREQHLQREDALETDNPAIRAWVAGLLADHENETIVQRSERLRLAVRSHITTKDLSVADGTASETFASRTGDCTEHANLLACALRIAGIAARTEVGVVYAAALGGWGGHAWVSAYDDDQGRWIHLDASYPGIPRSLYICTAIASGNDQRLGTLLQGLVGIMGGTIETL